MPSLPGPGGRLLIGVAVLATACSTNGGATAPMTLMTVPVVTTVAPLTQPELQAIVVQPSDLPAGWKPEPTSLKSTQSVDSSAFAGCVGALDTAGAFLSRAYSPNFVNGASVIASTASSFKSASDVQSDTAALTGATAADCFVSVVKAHWTATLPKGATLKSVTQTINPGANRGPATVVATVTGSIVFVTGKGKTLTLNSVVVFLAGTRLEVRIEFYRADESISAEFTAGVVAKVAARLPNGS